MVTGASINKDQQNTIESSQINTYLPNHLIFDKIPKQSYGKKKFFLTNGS